MEQTTKFSMVSLGMPVTASDRLRGGQGRRGQEQELQSEKGKPPENQHPSSPPPLPPPQPGDTVSPSVPSGSKSYDDVKDIKLGGPSLSLQYQHRPSVLRQGGQAGVLAVSKRLNVISSSQHLVRTVGVGAGHHSESPPPHSGSSPRHKRHSLPLRRSGLEPSSAEADLHDSSPGPVRAGEASVLFESGLCRWPGCDEAFEDSPSFLKHLHSEHGHGDKSIAQWRIQQDMVQYMESQLTLEKQKLFAMQLHLQFSEKNPTDLKSTTDWPYRVALFLPHPQVTDAAPHCATKEPEELAQHGYWPTATVHLLPDLVPSIECYKYNNIRPPYTYAYLIRWAILESPDRQRTLNEIYNWFTTMFFYFRHNTATWKNAVRHNLSLHKCFVRVEGGKGAVWTVDETEYQRRKGQKYFRDHPVKWTSYSNFCPQEP